jgi:hypothetical protein
LRAGRAGNTAIQAIFFEGCSKGSGKNCQAEKILKFSFIFNILTIFFAIFDRQFLPIIHRVFLASIKHKLKRNHPH